MKRIILLGATGSIGRSTVDVVRSHPDKFRFVGLTAHTNNPELHRIASEFSVKNTALTGSIPDTLDSDLQGIDAACTMIRQTDADIVVNGIAGASGLAPSITALQTGKDIALANKETIVMAGRLIRAVAEELHRRIIPVDSEHAALFYLLEGIPADRVSRLVLTASGGAFRNKSVDDLDRVTVAEALAHPTWSMGPKITIDSATMANKGLEVIEAVRLFNIPEDLIDVFIHRQSTIHALVRTRDGSFYAQLSDPDMRVPIQHALSYPDELPCPWGDIELDGLELSFERPNPLKYPALELAREAIRNDGEYPVAYNAANEVAVSAFVDGKIGFTQIAQVVKQCLAARWQNLLNSFEQVYEADAKARELSIAIVSRIAGP